MTQSRQVQRNNNRISTKAHSAAFMMKTRKMNPLRAKILHGLSVAMQNYFSPPAEIEIDIPLYKHEQLRLANDLNNEFMGRSRGKAGKKPARKQFIKSTMFARDNTNPIGHFA